MPELSERASSAAAYWPIQPIVEGDEVPYQVTGIERRTPAIVELWLRPLVKPLEYLPGEYVLLEDRDREVPPRSYSIANAPRPDRLISLLITQVEGGQTSGWVHNCLRTGDEVTITGPYGTFVADPASTAPCLHLAAGSGLAPIRALVEAALEAAPRRSLSLIFSARTEADVLDRDRFLGWQARNPHFRFVTTLTRGTGADLRGRIPDVLPDLCPDLAGHEVFVAGAPGFVLACASAAEALGAARERVHTEPFFVEPHPWTTTAGRASEAVTMASTLSPMRSQFGGHVQKSAG
jgi:CDP-4-dehydro-6-deoxyglucose reductase, E3